ncbi:Ankyrin repeat protein [Lasiodiplodia theobromae]|uniref:Ankyrin repeat protein n=1 Tax=Lasiodiplodia theobromae TaxID=45133 RepID=UPI0015C3535A|nr:Ankyrin repeat protein [Lasiodiplodia theobromae]KAF4545970.1 Ankyrin repeat protein [Lasiodiplodia theobromae]
MFSARSFGGRQYMKNYTINHAPHGCHILAFFGLADLLRLILDETKGSWDLIDEKNSEGETPLAMASIHGHPEVVELLLKIERVDPNTKTPRNMTPLHLAVLHDNHSVVKALLTSRRVDANCRGSHGNTPLHIAIEDENKALIRLMIDNFKDRINFNATDRARYTALHKAAKCEDSDIMKMLFEVLNDLIDFNAKDIDGWTALHHAYFYKRVAIQQFLYTQKDVFDTNVADYSGWNPQLDPANEKSWYYRTKGLSYEGRRGKSPHPLVYYLQNP